MTAPVKPGDQVWFTQSWRLEVIAHLPNRHDRGRRPWEQDGHTGTVANWCFTLCGLPMSYFQWDDEWSARESQFFTHAARGEMLPFRLLNPAHSRLCKNCLRAAP